MMEDEEGSMFGFIPGTRDGDDPAVEYPMGGNLPRGGNSMRIGDPHTHHSLTPGKTSRCETCARAKDAPNCGGQPETHGSSITVYCFSYKEDKPQAPALREIVRPPFHYDCQSLQVLNNAGDPVLKLNYSYDFSKYENGRQMAAAFLKFITAAMNDRNSTIKEMETNYVACPKYNDCKERRDPICLENYGWINEGIESLMYGPKECPYKKGKCE
jgi:hypothetical protein